MEPFTNYTMSNPFEMQKPATQSVTDRIEWAGERFADLAEGKLSIAEADFVVAYVYGWSDLCDVDSKRQYREMARNISELLSSIREAA